ncbi:MAG: hypothetical protein Q7K55_04570, partial [Candidatus Levybacteria bacterium]|nr:hypothetical protein [Candidatus Levybacteria bacterium]
MNKIEKIILTSAVFLLALVPLLWFSGNQILIGYDNIYPLNPIEFLKDRLFSWTIIQGFGRDQSGVQGSLLIHFLDSIPTLLGLSIQTGQKIIFSFWFFLILASSFILALRLERFAFVKAPYFKYIFPILVAFNLYILQAWWIAERTKFSVIIASLLLMSILLPLIKKSFTKLSVLKDSFLCALILSVFNGGGWEGISLYGGLFVILGSIYFLFIFQAISLRQGKRIIAFTFFLIIFGLWFILLNAYTFLPFLLTTLGDYKTLLLNAGGVEGLIGWTRYLSENSSFLNLLRLQGIPDLYNNGFGHPYAPYYLNKYTLIAASYLFPLFIFLMFWKKNKERTMICTFFLFVFLISLFFAAGTHKPFGFLFEKLMATIPGFIIFRSAIFKFGYAYWIAASFFIAIFLSEIIEYVKIKMAKSRLGQYIGIILFFGITGFLLFYHFPYFRGDIFRIDRTGVSSRVEIPKYVSDFSKWWMDNGKEDKILLLPELNDNSLYEQYRWGYLSLFPLLNNYGNKNIVENTDFLFPAERRLVNELYDAIQGRDYSKQDLLASILGIRYLLLRQDFYYDLQDQKADNPQDLQDKIDSNQSLRKVKDFEKWTVYEYKKKPPVFFSSSQAVAFSGFNFDIPYNIGDNKLLLDKDLYPMFPQEAFSHMVLWPGCSSCKAEKAEVSVAVSNPGALLDSPLYGLIEFKNRLRKKSFQNVEGELFDIVGEGLKSISQLNQLVVQDKDIKFIKQAADELVVRLDTIYGNLPRAKSQIPNPYITMTTLDQYLRVYDEYVNDLVNYTNKEETLIELQKTQFVINRVREAVREFYNEDDFSRKKAYIVNIVSKGNYSLRLKRSTLGSFMDDNDQLKIGILIDGFKVNLSPQLNGDYIDLGKAEFTEGAHVVALLLPGQRNVSTRTIRQNISGKTCLSSIVDDFNPDKSYEIRFSSRNTSDSTISLFIDGNQSFSPVFTRYFYMHRGQFVNNRIIVARDKVSLVESGNLRIGFCSSGFTESIFNDNIKNFSIAFLVEPELTLHK